MPELVRISNRVVGIVVHMPGVPDGRAGWFSRVGLLGQGRGC